MSRSPVDAAWLDEELIELERLVEAGETLDVISRLTAMMREPRLAGVTGAAETSPA